MAGNKLEIDVEAQTDEAQKAFDDLGQSIEKIEESTDKAAAASSKWTDAATDLKRVLPNAADAAGTEKLAEATLTASSATAVAQTRFQKLGYTIKQLGTTLASGLRSGFATFVASMGAIGAAAGRVLGGAFSAAFSSTGLGAILIAGAAIVQGLRKLAGAASKAGEEFAKAYTDSFAAGLDLSAFNELQAVFGRGFDTKSAGELASALGAIRKELALGTEEGKQASAAFAALGGDLQTLTEGGKPAAEQLVKIQEAYKSLSQMQQRDLLKLIFPDASVESLAKLDQLLEGTGSKLKVNAAYADELATSLNELSAAQKAAGEAAANFYDAAKNLGTAFLEITHLGDAWQQLADPAVLNAAADAMNRWAENVRQLPTMVQATVSQVNQAFQNMVTQIVATLDGLKQAITQAFTDAMAGAIAAVKSGVDTIVGLFTSMIETVKGLWGSFTSWLSSAYDTAVQWANKIRGAITGAFSGAINGPGVQAVPLQQQFSPFMRTAAGPMLAAPAGLVRASTALRASNDNMLGGSGLSSTINSILYNWDEYSKAVTKAGDDSVTAGAKITQSFNQAAAATTNMATAAQGSQAQMNSLAASASEFAQGFADWTGNALNSLLDAVVAGEDLSQVFKKLALDLAKMIIQMLIIKPLMNSLSSAFGGIGGGLFGATGLTSAMMAAPATAGIMARGLAAPAPLTGLSNIAGRSRAKAANGNQQPTTVQNNIGDIGIDMSETGLVVGSTQDAKEMGKQIQSAVQAILVKESRPGGLLRRVA